MGCGPSCFSLDHINQGFEAAGAGDRHDAKRLRAVALVERAQRRETFLPRMPEQGIDKYFELIAVGL
jgi:hypothetical protein